MNNVQPVNAMFMTPGKINEWKKTGKVKYEIWACRPGPGTKVHNVLENSDYVTSAQKTVVLSGTVGEQWVIDEAKLAKTYTFATGESITPESLDRRMPIAGDWTKIATLPGIMENYALFLDIKKYTNVPIATSWGEVLYANRTGVKHADGDYLVCGMLPDGSPNFQDMWVVNGCIFAATYNLKNITVSARMKQMILSKPSKPEKLSNDNKPSDLSRALVGLVGKSIQFLSEQLKALNTGANNLTNLSLTEIKPETPQMSIGTLRTKAQQQTPNIERLMYLSYLHGPHLDVVPNDALIKCFRIDTNYTYKISSTYTQESKSVVMIAAMQDPLMSSRFKNIMFIAVPCDSAGRAIIGAKDFVQTVYIPVIDESTLMTFDCTKMYDILRVVTRLHVPIEEIAKMELLNAKVGLQDAKTAIMVSTTASTGTANSNYTDASTLVKRTREIKEKEGWIVDGTHNVNFTLQIEEQNNPKKMYSAFTISRLYNGNNTSIRKINMGGMNTVDFDSIGQFRLNFDLVKFKESIDTLQTKVRAFKILYGSPLSLYIISNIAYSELAAIGNIAGAKLDIEKQYWALNNSIIAKFAETFRSAAYTVDTPGKNKEADSIAEAIKNYGSAKQLITNNWGKYDAYNWAKATLKLLDDTQKQISVKTATMMCLTALFYAKSHSILRAINTNGLRRVISDETRPICMISYCDNHFTYQHTDSITDADGFGTGTYTITNGTVQANGISALNNQFNSSDLAATVDGIYKLILNFRNKGIGGYETEMALAADIVTETPIGRTVSASFDKFMLHILNSKDSHFLKNIKQTKDAYIKALTDLLETLGIVGSKTFGKDNESVKITVENGEYSDNTASNYIGLQYYNNTLITSIRKHGEEQKDYRFALDDDYKASIVAYKVIASVSRVLHINPVVKQIMNRQTWETITEIITENKPTRKFQIKKPEQLANGNIVIQCRYLVTYEDGFTEERQINIHCTTDIVYIRTMSPIKYVNMETTASYDQLYSAVKDETDVLNMCTFGFRIEGANIVNVPWTYMIWNAELFGKAISETLEDSLDYGEHKH